MEGGQAMQQRAGKVTAAPQRSEAQISNPQTHAYIRSCSLPECKKCKHLFGASAQPTRTQVKFRTLLARHRLSNRHCTPRRQLCSCLSQDLHCVCLSAGVPRQSHISTELRRLRTDSPRANAATTVRRPCPARTGTPATIQTRWN